MRLKEYAFTGFAPNTKIAPFFPKKSKRLSFPRRRESNLSARFYVDPRFREDDRWEAANKLFYRKPTNPLEHIL